MSKELVTFETAKLAKEKGFNENVDNIIEISNGMSYSKLDKQRSYKYYKHEPLNKTVYLHPTQSLLQRWLREVYNIDVTVQTNHSQLRDSKRSYNVHLIYDVYDRYYLDENNKVAYFATYEEALEVGLYQALKLI